jgi:cytoskeletal protein RodZ
MDDVCLSVESSFRYRFNGESVNWNPEATKAASTVVNLLGSSVAEVKKLNVETLELTFTNGDVLQVFDNSKEYESFTITRPGVTIVV